VLSTIDRSFSVVSAIGNLFIIASYVSFKSLRKVGLPTHSLALSRCLAL
jgi:hypothetical protein